MRSREYKAIKNFVHNELGLTKLDCENLFKEDIFDESKKVIKQESNLGILIDKDGNVKIGRTRFACDKNRNYKLKQI